MHRQVNQLLINSTLFFVYDELLTLVGKGWTCLKVFWLSKDNSAGHSTRKRRKGRQKKRWEDNIKEWTGVDLASSTRAVEDRTRWKRIVVKSSVMLQRPHKFMG